MKMRMAAALVVAGLLSTNVTAQATQSAKGKAAAQAGKAKGKGMKGQAKGAGAQKAMEHKAEGPWKEMNAFHAVLAGTFHPASEAKNLKPLRMRAADLSKTAQAWSASTAPTACTGEAVRSSVTAISSDAAALSAKVDAKAADADLLAGITAIHDRFETVEKACGAHAEMKHEMKDAEKAKGEMQHDMKDHDMKGMKHDMKDMKDMKGMKDMKKPAKKDSTSR